MRRRTGIATPAIGIAAGFSLCAAIYLMTGGPVTGTAVQAQAHAAPLEAREHLRRGVELARQGLHDGAVAELRRSIEIYPDDAEAHFFLGRSMREMAIRQKLSLAGAIRELERAFELDPSKDYIKQNLAEAYGTRKSGTFAPEKAIHLMGELLEKHPDRYDGRQRFAEWMVAAEVRLARRGDPKRPYQDSAWTMDVVRFHLEKVLDQAPPDSTTAIQARTLLGEVLLRSGEYDRARATFEQLLPQFEGNAVNQAPNWNSIGHCRYRKGEFKEAAEAFRKAYDLAPTLPFQWDIRMAYDRIGGYPKDLPERYRFPLRPEKYDPASPPNLKFTDIGARLHVNKYAGAGPTGWVDYNGDGRLDLFACGCDTYCDLFRAEGDGFVNATIDSKLTRLEPGFGAAWGDYDNDGDPDLYISRNGWNGPAPDGLYRNDGDGTFSDVTEAAGVADDGSSFHVAWTDYDRDGWLDLVVSNGVYLDGSNNRLLRNRGDGTFEDATAKAGLTEDEPYGTIGVAIGDYDEDGWVDIFFHGRMSANRLYHNNRDGTFTNVAQRAGVAGPGTQNGFIAFFADLDSDGDLDIWTGSLADYGQVLAAYRPEYRSGPLDDIPRLFRNNGDGTFTDSSLTSGFRYPVGIMAAGIGDVDNDGYIDIYTGTGNPSMRRLEPNLFYHNRAGQTFEDMSRFSGLWVLGKGHGIVYHDWDGDGDLEIYKELGGFYHGDFWENAFFLNEAGSRNNWLSVRLRQPEKNRDAVTARVTARAETWALSQQVTAGQGFGSTDPPILHFGLGRRAKVDRLEVRWPDGRTQILNNVKANQRLTIQRDEAAAR